MRDQLLIARDEGVALNEQLRGKIQDAGGRQHLKDQVKADGAESEEIKVPQASKDDSPLEREKPQKDCAPQVKAHPIHVTKIDKQGAGGSALRFEAEQHRQDEVAENVIDGGDAGRPEEPELLAPNGDGDRDAQPDIEPAEEEPAVQQ